MAIPSTRSRSYDALLSTTLDNIRPGLFDQIFSSNPFFAALYGKFGAKKKAGKGIKMIDGGDNIRTTLLYGKNSTVKSYSGYDILDTTPQDGITAAFYPWKQIAGSISISRLEERKNSGKARIRNLLEDKIDQCRMSMEEECNLQLLGKTVSSSVFIEGNGMSSETDFTPISKYIPKDPTTSVSIGNIDQGTYSWWRPRVIDGSAAHASKDSGADRGYNTATYKNLFMAMSHLYNLCSRGPGGGPGLILTDQMSYESYEAGLEERSRIVNDAKGPVSAGFESIRYKAADMVFDEKVPDMDTGVVWDDSNWAKGTMFFLNLNYLEIVMDTETDFITTPFVRPMAQDAKTAQILAMMNLTCSNRRKQGILYGIPVPVIA